MGFPGIFYDLIGRLRDFVSQVKSYELREVGAEFKWFFIENEEA